jgi:hypothetical protein
MVRLIRRTGGAAAPPPTAETLARPDLLGNLWLLPLGIGTAPTARTVPPVTPGAAGLTAYRRAYRSALRAPSQWWGHASDPGPHP